MVSAAVERCQKLKQADLPDAEIPMVSFFVHRWVILIPHRRVYLVLVTAGDTKRRRKIAKVAQLSWVAWRQIATHHIRAIASLESMAAYHSISVDGDHDANHPNIHNHHVAHNCPSRNTQNRWGVTYYLAFFAVLVLATIATGRGWIHNQIHHHNQIDHPQRQGNDIDASIATSDDSSPFQPLSEVVNNENIDKRLLLPTGVNLGSWFSLEDWFFVGQNGAVEVATPDNDTAAACLPPLHLDASTGPRWNSETDLLVGLVEHYRTTATATTAADATTAKEIGPWGKAIKTFHAFRTSFYDIDVELRNMKDLGIQYVRVPLSWCWTDCDPLSIVIKNETEGAPKDSAIYMTDEEVRERFTCPDPFYDNVYWPAIPRSYIIQFLRACAKYGLGATLDMHTYPGGTSIGTFSGVWPKYPRFWTYGDVPAMENYGKKDNRDIGRSLLKDFIVWVESLADEDPLAFKGYDILSVTFVRINSYICETKPQQ